MNTPDVVLEIQTPVPGVFVLNRSTLDGSDTLAGPGTSGLTWTPIQCDATSVEVTRGGSAETGTVQSEVGTLTATFLNAVNPLEDPAAYRPGLPCRLRCGPFLETQFTGLTQGFTVTYDKHTDDTYVTMSAVDAVQAVANTMRYGAANPVTEYDLWAPRFQRLLVSSPVPFNVPPVDTPAAHVQFDLEDAAIAGAGDWYGTWSAFTAGGVDSWRGTGYVSLYLEPGAIYDLEIESRQGTAVTVSIDMVGDVLVIPAAVGGSKATARFTAVQSSHWIFFTPASGNVDLERLKLTQHIRGPRLANIVHESDLASHLDIAATTAGVNWFVDRYGVIQIADPANHPDVYLTFADDTTTPMSYTELTIGYDTVAVINQITLDNHARAKDDEGNWEADDRTIGPFRDIDSAATYGQRAGTLETSLYEGSAYVYTDGAQVLAARVLAAFSEPTVAPSSITINVTDTTADPVLLSNLELFALIDVKWRGTTYTRTIVAINHTITPKTHLITLTLKEA